MMDERIARIASQLKEDGRKNIFFTGAGISTESGIPDYRSQGGIWDKFRPVYFDEFMRSKESRQEYWRQWQKLYRDIQQARPNVGHTSIARLDQLGLVRAVITQNVDGLHQLSGIAAEKIIELHGNTHRIRCLHCRETISTEDIQRRLASGDPAPQCRCGGYFKPDTISFGQAMPVAEVEKAVSLSRACRFFGVVGSTLVVQPAAHMPVYAKQNGAFLAIINLSETPCDDLCDVLIREKAGPVLQEIVKAVESGG
jgi:NAD-dependent deacetylase